MNGTKEHGRKRRKVDKPIAEQAEELRETLEATLNEREEVTEKIRKVLAEYTSFYSNVDTLVAKESASRDEDDEFSDTVRGLKGTGLQKSNELQTIRQMRRSRGLTLRSLSSELGLPYPHLSEIERGIRFPLDDERRVIEEWAGGQLSFRFVPYVLIRPARGE